MHTQQNNVDYGHLGQVVVLELATFRLRWDTRSCADVCIILVTTRSRKQSHKAMYNCKINKGLHIAYSVWIATVYATVKRFVIIHKGMSMTTLQCQTVWDNGTTLSEFSP